MKRCSPRANSGKIPNRPPPPIGSNSLQRELESTSPPRGILGKLFTKKPPAPRGIYLWGGVGRGKSMLMDLFHDSLNIRRKRRVHFHAFMLEVHALLREERKKEAGDPILPVAAKLGEDVRCLAFDEMVVNNSADAMIMSRLFTSLILDQGVTIVTTSNRAPGELYKDGLNREHFLPFIALIERELDVLPLNGPVDYRLERLGGMDTWHTPLGDPATAQVREAFFRLTDYSPDDYEHVPSAQLNVGRGPDADSAQDAERRGRIQLQEALRGGTRRSGLSGGRPDLSHRDPGRHSAHGAGQPQRGCPVRHADRRAL